MLRSFVLTTPRLVNKFLTKNQTTCRSLSSKVDIKSQTQLNNNNNNDTDDGVGGNGGSGTIKHRQLELDKVSIKLILNVFYKINKFLK